MNRIKVKDNEDLIKDTENGAIINTNFSKFNEYKKNKLKNKKVEERLSSLEEKMEEMLSLMLKLKGSIDGGSGQ